MAWTAGPAAGGSEARQGPANCSGGTCEALGRAVCVVDGSSRCGQGGSQAWEPFRSLPTRAPHFTAERHKEGLSLPCTPRPCSALLRSQPGGAAASALSLSACDPGLPVVNTARLQRASQPGPTAPVRDQRGACWRTTCRSRVSVLVRSVTDTPPHRGTRLWRAVACVTLPATGTPQTGLGGPAGEHV